MHLTFYRKVHVHVHVHAIRFSFEEIIFKIHFIEQKQYYLAELLFHQLICN